MVQCAPAQALPGFKKDLNKKRKAKIPESEYKEGPQGLKYVYPRIPGIRFYRMLFPLGFIECTRRQPHSTQRLNQLSFTHLESLSKFWSQCCMETAEA